MTRPAAEPEGNGQSLPPTVQGFMEARLGHDFSQVRVHTDARAARQASALGARAYTVGRHIVFGAGQFAPSNLDGRRLLAHELTHVVQAQGAGMHSDMARHTDRIGNLSRRDDPAEREADEIARQVAGPPADGRAALVPVHRVAALVLARPAAGVVYRDEASAMSVASPKNPAHEADREAARDALDQWKDRANEAVIWTSKWYSDNWGAFIAKTGSRPVVHWTDGKLYALLSAVTGWSIKKVGTAGAGAALGVEVGSAAGPPGLVIGLVVGLMASKIVEKITAWLSGSQARQAKAVEAAVGEATASSNEFFDQAVAGQAEVRRAFDTVKNNLSVAQDYETVKRIYTWALAEQNQVRVPSTGDRSLFDQMYRDWVLEHAGAADFMGGIGAGKGVDAVQFKAGVQNAKGLGGGIKERLDLFGYQTRGHWGQAGLWTERAQAMIDATAGLPVWRWQEADAFDRKTYKFASAANTGKLLKFLVENGAADPGNKRDLDAGNFEVRCTIHLTFTRQLKRAPGPGIVYSSPYDNCLVDKWTYEVDLPDRKQIDLSHDPVDAGRPPIVVGTGTVRTRKFEVAP